MRHWTFRIRNPMFWREWRLQSDVFVYSVQCTQLTLLTELKFLKVIAPSLFLPHVLAAAAAAERWAACLHFPRLALSHLSCFTHSQPARRQLEKIQDGGSAGMGLEKKSSLIADNLCLYYHDFKISIRILFFKYILWTFSCTFTIFLNFFLNGFTLLHYINLTFFWSPY
jgi:hypothetical protein